MSCIIIRKQPAFGCERQPDLGVTSMLKDNIFKKIIDKQIPAKIIHEDELCIAFHDTNPQAPVHVLIIPRKEIPTHAEVSAEDEAVMGRLHLVAANLARQLGLKEGYR